MEEVAPHWHLARTVRGHSLGAINGQADRARPVLLASVGRGPSDVPGVRGDSAADLGVALADGVRAGGYWSGETLAKETREGWWSVRNGPKLPVGS